MRMLRFGISYVLVNIFALLVFAFLAQNWRPEHLTYFGFSRSVNLGVILAGSAVFGFLVCLFLFMPGRIALSFHAWGLDREAEELEQQVAQLRDQREELLERFDNLVDGHERVLRRYNQLVAEHREIVADRDRLRAVVGKITAPIPVPEVREGKGPTPSPAPKEKIATAAVAEEITATAAVAEEDITAAAATGTTLEERKSSSLVRLTRRLLPTAIWP